MFKCRYCDDEFATAVALFVHLLRHTGNVRQLPGVAERRFATDPLERQRAGSRRAEDRHGR